MRLGRKATGPPGSAELPNVVAPLPGVIFGAKRDFGSVRSSDAAVRKPLFPAVWSESSGARTRRPSSGGLRFLANATRMSNRDEKRPAMERQHANQRCAPVRARRRPEIGVRPCQLQDAPRLRPGVTDTLSCAWGSASGGDVKALWGGLCRFALGVFVRVNLRGPGSRGPVGGGVWSVGGWGPATPTVFPLVLSLGKERAASLP